MKTRIGFHCSHEQFAPRELLRLAMKAQQSGFRHIECSDHFAPWSEVQGQSGHAWCWMGAALMATSHTCGTVTTPGYRYHPAIVAQMGATLAQMFPGRLWLALGSGEFLNESIIGKGWPPKNERNARLKESAAVIRALWRGETVTHYGRITAVDARLYTLPEKTPLLLGAALTAQSARFIAPFTDGLLTSSGPREKVREVVESYKDGGGYGKHCYLKMDISYGHDRDTALHQAWEQWRYTLLGPSVMGELRNPGQFEAAAKLVTLEHVSESVLVTDDPRRIADAVRRYAELGFEQINLHNVNRAQERFIEDFGPVLKDGSID